MTQKKFKQKKFVQEKSYRSTDQKKVFRCWEKRLATKQIYKKNLSLGDDHTDKTSSHFFASEFFPSSKDLFASSFHRTSWLGGDHGRRRDCFCEFDSRRRFPVFENCAQNGETNIARFCHRGPIFFNFGTQFRMYKFSKEVL